jgi:hypothetical protein
MGIIFTPLVSLKPPLVKVGFKSTEYRLEIRNKEQDIMCRCANVQMCKFLGSIAVQNLHICTSAHYSLFLISICFLYL